MILIKRMANNPTNMSGKILRLYWQEYNMPMIANETGVLRNTRKKYIKEFERSGLYNAEVNDRRDKNEFEIYKINFGIRLSPFSPQSFIFRHDKIIIN